MAMDQFRRYMAPDFQAPQGPLMDWQQMGGESQGVGQDFSSILKQLKGGQAEDRQSGGFGTKDIIGGGARKTGGGMNSL